MAKSKNVTFSLPQDLIDKYKGYAEMKYIPSVNSAVREAMEQYGKRIEKERLQREMLAASKDPMFVQDLDESMKALSLG